MGRLKAGIIGCGGIAKTHMRGWQALEQVDLVACADLGAEAARAFADEHGVARGYGDARTMLAAEALDLVSICTWTGTHAELTIAAASAGVRGILCEKPMARNLGECDAMMAAAERHGAKLVIGYHHRFRPPNLTIRKLLADGAIGRPTLLGARIEGGLANNGSHLIDRAAWWLDCPATWVMANFERRTNRHERREPIEDRAAAVIAWANGARYVIETDTPAVGLPDDVFIHGTEGMLKLVGWKDLYRFTDGWQPVEPLPDTTQFAALLAWLEGGPEPRNAARHGRATLELVQAVYESVRRRGLVELPLENLASPFQQLLDGGRLPLESTEYYDVRLKT